MLQPLLKATQSPTDPNLLLVEDVTPAYNAQTAPGGYGSPNISRSALTHVIFRLTLSSGRTYSTAPTFWVSGVYRLFSSAFKADSDQACGCTSTCQCKSSLELADGRYDLAYEVYGLTGIPAQSGNYHLELPLCYLDQVWVQQAGVWTNITSLGATNEEGNWEWTVFDTTTSYTGYEVRNYHDASFGYIKRQTGTVDAILAASPTQPTTTSETPALVATYMSRSLLLMQRSTRRLALVSKALLTSVAIRRVSVDTDTILELYTAQELLDDILSQPASDAAGMAQAITDLDQRIDFLETRQTYQS